MRLDIVEFVESFLENKRKKQDKTDSEFKKRLIENGVSDDHAHDLVLYMDDEWTNEQFTVSKLNYAKLNMIVGYLLGTTGLALTILSYYGFLGEGVGVIFFYGAIAG